ncbi:MAG: folate-binding protein [Erythrobacter sp.]
MASNTLKNRAIIRLCVTEAGEDVRDFLQGLVTNDVSGELPVYAALLSAQGKTMFDFLVWADGDDVLLDCEAAACADLVKRLSLYRLRRKIAIDRDESLGVFWSNDALEGASPDPRLSALGHRWIAPANTADGGADAAWLAHRLSLGVPEGHAELGDILWLETNAVELNGVDFEKGCYIGQENTARMNWRSKVNRRLVVVPLAQSQEKRCKITHAELGLAVDHLRLDDINKDAAPEWMQTGLTSAD